MANPVSNLTTSFLLLAIGLTILWLAATNRLSNFLTAWQALSANPGTAADLQSQLSQQMGGPATSNVNTPLSIPGVGTVTLPVPIPISGANAGTTPTANQLEVGGGLSYHLPTLPSVGTLTVH